MAKRTITNSNAIEIDDSAGSISYHYADDSTPPEAGGPGALILMFTPNGSPRSVRRVISKADLSKAVKLPELFASLAAEVV